MHCYLNSLAKAWKNYLPLNTNNMPYKSREEIPDQVQSALKDVPHAQDIYKEAYNSAFAEYADPDNRRKDYDREETAHAVAWNAVKQKYEKGDDEKWHPID